MEEKASFDIASSQEKDSKIKELDMVRLLNDSNLGTSFIYQLIINNPFFHPQQGFIFSPQLLNS